MGGLLGWFWESPEVTAFEGERFACLRSPQSCHSQLRSQIPLFSQCPTGAPDMARADDCLLDKN